MKPRVAVIIPCFDDGTVVEDAVRSVCEDEPVELVVVDDGSTDPATVKALERLGASGTRIIRQENGGASAARNAGLARTVAPYVFPLDADDVLLPGALRTLADDMERHPGAAFVFGDYDMFGVRSARWTLPEWDPWALLYTNFWSPSMLFRRSALQDVGGWDWHECAEDWALLLALAEHGHRGRRCNVVTHKQRQAERRRTQTCRDRYDEWFPVLRMRHAGLYAKRSELRRRSRPAAWKRIAYPLLLGRRRAYPPWLEDALWPLRVVLRAGDAKPPVPPAAAA